MSKSHSRVCVEGDFFCEISAIEVPFFENLLWRWGCRRKYGPHVWGEPARDGIAAVYPVDRSVCIASKLAPTEAACCVERYALS